MHTTRQSAFRSRLLALGRIYTIEPEAPSVPLRIDDVVSRAIAHFTCEDGELHAVIPRRPEAPLVMLLGAKDSGRINSRIGTPILQGVRLDLAGHLTIQQLVVPANTLPKGDQKNARMLGTKDSFWHAANGHWTLVLNLGQSSSTELLKCWEKLTRRFTLVPLSNDVTVKIPFLGDNNTHRCSGQRFWNGFMTSDIDEMVEPGQHSSFEDFVTTEDFRSPTLCGPACPPLHSPPAANVGPIGDSSNSHQGSDVSGVTHFQIFDVAGAPSGQVVSSFDFIVVWDTLISLLSTHTVNQSIVDGNINEFLASHDINHDPGSNIGLAGDFGATASPGFAPIPGPSEDEVFCLFWHSVFR